MLRKIFENRKIWAGVYCLYLIVPILTIVFDAKSLYFDVWPTLILAASEAVIPLLIYKAIRYFIYANDND